MIRNEILDKESAGEISPINEYIKHTLKAFAMHLENMSAVSRVLSSKKKSSKSDGVMASAGDERILMVSGYEIIQQGSKYYVRKNVDKVIAKAAFREIIKKEKLSKIKLKNKKGRELTTYQLGTAVWKAYST